MYVLNTITIYSITVEGTKQGLWYQVNLRADNSILSYWEAMVGYYDKDFNMQYKVHTAKLHLENKL